MLNSVAMALLTARFRRELPSMAMRVESLATKQDILDLRAEMHALAGGIARQMYLAVLGQMAVLLGFAYFFATHIR
jgi:hypothetical protein